jgi:hypothetical protein
MQNPSIKPFRFATRAGIIASILFVVIFTIEGIYRPGYSSIGMYVSALSLGSRGFIQIANFLIFGILFLLFARNVAAEFKKSNVSQIGPILLTIFAICLFLSGPFVMDPFGTPPQAMTIHGVVHSILGGIAFLIMPISCFVFLRVFRQNSIWNSFAPWTLLMSILLSATLALFIFATKLPYGKNIFHSWFGLLQRMVLIPYMLWLFTFARAFYRRVLNQRI